MGRHYRADYLLWAVASGAVFTALGFVRWCDGRCANLWVKCGQLMFGAPGGTSGDDLVFEVWVWWAVWTVAAIPTGWLIHAVLVMRGVRLTGGRPHEQAIHYDDAPPAG
jgi:hypothetical protein